MSDDALLRKLESLRDASSSSRRVDTIVDDKLNLELRNKLTQGLFLIYSRLEGEMAKAIQNQSERLFVRSYRSTENPNRFTQVIETSDMRFTTPLMLDGEKGIEIVDNKNDRTLLSDEFMRRFEVLVGRISDGRFDRILRYNPNLIIHAIMGQSGELLVPMGVDPQKGETHLMIDDELKKKSSQLISGTVDLVTPAKPIIEALIAAWNRKRMEDKILASNLLGDRIGIIGFSLNEQLNMAMKLPKETQGALVIGVFKGSLAEKAGFRVGSIPAFFDGELGMLGGDIVISIQGRQITGMDEFKGYLNNFHTRGTQIKFGVLRERKFIQITLKY